VQDPSLELGVHAPALSAGEHFFQHLLSEVVSQTGGGTLFIVHIREILEIGGFRKRRWIKTNDIKGDVSLDVGPHQVVFVVESELTEALRGLAQVQQIVEGNEAENLELDLEREGKEVFA